MYVYFKLMNSVVTCEEYPQILSVDEMKSNNLQNLCNKWEKNVSKDGTFTLSFKYKKPICDCNNSQHVNMFDYDNYECYNCGTCKTLLFKEGDNLYLQNSGNIDVLCVKPTNKFCKLCEVDGHPNVYKWISNDSKLMFVLHIKNGILSDENILNEINIIQENCYTIFTECV